MMNNSKKFLLGLFTLCVVLVGCSDDDDSYSYSSSTDALITKFVLPNNATYATGLSYVYFSIDQYGEYEEGKGLVGQIFNADSLPVGTITNSLLAESTTASASEIMLFTYSDSTMTYSDSVIYSTTDSINCTHPVKVRVTAADKVTRKYYDIKVNVHQANPDSLDWSLLVNDPLSDFTNITDQKAVVSGDEAYWYIESTTGITLYTAPKNDLVSWTKQSCSFPADANVILESLKLFNDDFYCVTNDGALLKSTDGKSFSKYSSEYTFKNLIGSYGSDDDVAQFIAIVYDNNDYYFAYSLNALSWSLGDKLDKYFPVSGSSDAFNLLF